MKILVVDDSKAMRMIVSRAIKASPAYASATILEAVNGRDALAVAEAESPDVIISDWNMPEVNGLELLDTLRASGATTPFGFVTSESTPEMYERAMASGAGFLVSKPFTPEALARALADTV